MKFGAQKHFSVTLWVVMVSRLFMYRIGLLQSLPNQGHFGHQMLKLVQ